MILNKYRNLPHNQLISEPIICIYQNLLEGRIKAMPKGTWQSDQHVVCLIRYVLEVKLGLAKEEIPKITRKTIKANKLFGALNKFKSVHKLIHFVYPGVYHECDFQRVSPGYWSDISRIRERFEWRLEKEKLAIAEIPSFISCELFLKCGFSNPLKRYGDSPIQLINAMYPNRFKETDFKNLPQGYRKSSESLKKQLLDILQNENIPMGEVPQKVNRDFLRNHRLLGVLSSYSNSVSKLFCSLFPEYFSIDSFVQKPNGYWDEMENVREAIRILLEKNNVPEKDIPAFLTKKRFQEENLGGLLYRFNGSPIEIVQALYPGRFSITEFQRVPNKYWYSKENRVKALRDYCERQGIPREKLPLLNRAYFHKHFPRFISIADRHYESKFYRWTMESFPEYKFELEEFQLLAGNDGQICNSKEELVLHNFFIEAFVDAKIKREGEQFINKQAN